MLDGVAHARAVGAVGGGVQRALHAGDARDGVFGRLGPLDLQRDQGRGAEAGEWGDGGGGLGVGDVDGGGGAGAIVLLGWLLLSLGRGLLLLLLFLLLRVDDGEVAEVGGRVVGGAFGGAAEAR